MSKLSMPSFFASLNLAQRAGDVQLPAAAVVPETRTAFSPLTEAQNRPRSGGGFRASLNAAARKLKSGADFKDGAKTRCYTPFTTRTTSPKKQPSPQLHNSDTPRAQLDDERIAPRPSAERHGQATQARLTEKFREDAALRRLADKHAYLHFLNAKGSFSRTGDDKARETLLLVLNDIAGLPGIAGTKADAMQGVGMLCVMEAALQACANDAAAAARALCCLRNIDLLASIRHPERMPASVTKPDIGCPAMGPHGGGNLDQFTEQDLALAWRIAQELEATPAGFAALKSLTLHDTVVPDAHPSIEQHDDMMLHAYLQASREKCATALGRGLPAPAAPHPMATLDGKPATVLDKGIVQIRKHLLASHKHILSKPAAPFAYQAQPGEHEWAIGFIRNGLYTDEDTINGKPTAYARIEGRLNKVALWCERATSGSGAASTAWRKAAPYLLPGHHKSPLNAYNSLEAGRGLRKCGVGLENAAQGCIQDGRAFREHILGNLIKALKTSGGANGGPLNTHAGGNCRDPSATALRNLARLALLMETDDHAAPFVTLLHGAAPDQYTVEQARKRIYSWLAGGEAGQHQTTRDAVARALSDEARPLTLDRLQEWAAALPGAPGKESPAPTGFSRKPTDDMQFRLPPIQRSSDTASVGGAKTDDKLLAENDLQDFIQAIDRAFDPPDTKVPEADRPDWAAFANAARQVREGAGEPAPSPHFRKLGDVPDKLGVVGEVIERAAAGMELGTRLSFSSGGFSGAGAKEITRFLSSVFSFGLVRPRVDASMVRKREAVLELETSVGGNQIFVGTRRSLKMQAGGGIGIGPAAKIRGVGGVKAGASFDAFASMEQPATHGVQLRLPRTRSGGMAGDRTNNILLGHLFRKYVIERKSPVLQRDHAARAPGKDGESTLKNLLQACPMLGVGLLDTTECIVREGVSVAGGVSASAGPLSAGLSAGIKYEEKHARTLNWDESKAALNVIKSGHGISRTVALTGQVHALQQIPDAAKNLSGAQTARGLRARMKQAAGGLLNAMCVTSKEVGNWGGSGSYTLLLENGAISDGSRAAVVHRDAESLIASVAPRLDQWATAMANRFQKEKTNAGKTYRQEAYDRAYAMLRAQLEDARKHGDTHTEFYELTAESLETATALRSAMAMLERSGNTEQAAVLSKKLDALLASDAAWMPHLICTQRTSRGETSTGLHFGIYAGKTDAVSSTSIKMLG